MYVHTSEASQLERRDFRSLPSLLSKYLSQQSHLHLPRISVFDLGWDTRGYSSILFSELAPFAQV